MSYMFAYCKLLIELDLSNFDISNVTNMNSMFHMGWNSNDISVLTTIGNVSNNRKS